MKSKWMNRRAEWAEIKSEQIIFEFIRIIKKNWHFTADKKEEIMSMALSTLMMLWHKYLYENWFWMTWIAKAIDNADEFLRKFYTAPKVKSLDVLALRVGKFFKSISEIVLDELLNRVTVDTRTEHKMNINCECWCWWKSTSHQANILLANWSRSVHASKNTSQLSIFAANACKPWRKLRCKSDSWDIVYVYHLEFHEIAPFVVNDRNRTMRTFCELEWNSGKFCACRLQPNKIIKMNFREMSMPHFS